MMMMMISQNVVTHPLELVSWVYEYIIQQCDLTLCIYYIGIQENIKGGGVDHDSGLGTSKYKSSLSCTMSNVRTDS